MYSPTLSEVELENKFSKLKKVNYNKFFWWRMYDNKNPPLHVYTPLIDRIKNGDFNYSHYNYQAQWCEHKMNELYMIIGSEDVGRYVEESSLLRTKRKRLLEDFIKDEKDKLANLTKELALNFKLTKEEVKNYMENFGGSIEDLYIMLKEKYPYNEYYLPKFLLKRP